MYKRCFATRIKDNDYNIHLWTDNGYEYTRWSYPAYELSDSENCKYKTLDGLGVDEVLTWRDGDDVIFNDMSPVQRYLIERYGTNDTPSKTHEEVFFDIEIEIGDTLTPQYIESAPKPVTSIAWYHKQADKWCILILDKNCELEYSKFDNKEIIPYNTEAELLIAFLEKMRVINPDILVGYNSDYFDIPYLYFRICNVLDSECASMLSPINRAWKTKDNGKEKDKFVNIVGLECLDYMRLLKKYSMSDEASYKLDAVGLKYLNKGKIEYEGTLDKLFKEDKNKFIEYNFRDVEILKELDEKFKYIEITKNLAHKGKILYSEVYGSSKIHDGAISTFLLSQNIIPPSRDSNQITKPGFAGGYVFCPYAGLFKFVFDVDLTSLYPSIIRSLNIGKETYLGSIVNDKNNINYDLNGLKQMDQESYLNITNYVNKNTKIKVKDLIDNIIKNKIIISANGAMYTSKKKSALVTILSLWFAERVEYKNLMKKYSKAGDKILANEYDTKQYVIKILLNSLFGALALKSFRYGGAIHAETVTLTGQKIITYSANTINKAINKKIKQ